MADENKLNPLGLPILKDGDSKRMFDLFYENPISFAWFCMFTVLFEAYGNCI